MTQRTLFPHLLASALGLALLALPGCSTDHVEADYVAVQAPDATGDGLAPFLISGAFDDGQMVYVRLDGNDLALAGERVGFGAGTTVAFSAPEGNYVVELVNGDENVLLRTPALSFEPDHLNDLLAYGDVDSLDYLYNSHDWTAVSAGKVQANFFNAMTRRISGKLELCSFDGDTETCDVLAASLAYGEGWSGEVAPGTRFEFTPDVADSDQLELWSSEHGTEGYTPGRMTRVNAYYPLDWVDLDDADCPGCTSAFEHNEDFFIAP